MPIELAQLAYLLAAALFIVGLKRLSSPATARSGNRLAAVGMLIAVVVTLLDRGVIDYLWLAVGLVIGGGIGAVLAKRVAMTGMPELVAAFNGFGGGASALVAASQYLAEGEGELVTSVALGLSVLVGAITLTGSFVAFGKLSGRIPGRPVTFGGQRVVDALVGIVALGAIGWFALGGEGIDVAFWVLMGVSLLLGITRVLPIGGGDMPVVIAFLNSLSGVAASMAGFAIDSTVLIISGALVGASGLILTNIMVKAMNRTLIDVLAGGFGVSDGAGGADLGDRTVRRTSADDLAIVLGYAQSVVVVPGYGLAVAQAQHALRELADLLGDRDVDVRYAIHPVAGRMPGHMNVLLAEADVPYDRLYDLEDINADFSHTDVVLVVGANDVVNPSAREDPGSPIYGMPILDVDKAQTCVVVKRSLSPGFAGIDNPLFYRENTLMFFADAKGAIEDVVREVRQS